MASIIFTISGLLCLAIGLYYATTDIDIAGLVSLFIWSNTYFIMAKVFHKEE